MAAGNIPRRCRNCGRYFLAVGGYDTVYCSNVAPGEKKKTCRQVGAHRTEEKIKNDSSPIQKEYKRAYGRLKARKRRGTLSVDEWNRKVAKAQQLRDEAVAGKMDVVTLRMRLEMLRRGQLLMLTLWVAIAEMIHFSVFLSSHPSSHYKKLSSCDSFL